MGGRMDGLEQSQLPRKDLSQECKNSVSRWLKLSEVVDEGFSNLSERN